jgi:putative glutamine amidotransferase
MSACTLGPWAGCAVLLPAAGEALVAGDPARLDGLILTGSRSNVWPGHYDGPAHAEGTPEDPQRDATTLPLIRAAIAAGLPVLAICRGMQELNVALGGSLDQRIQDLPGRMDHSTPSDQPCPRPDRQGPCGAHRARRHAGAHLGRQPACPPAEAIPVNSLHNQGVQRLAPRLVAEAWAPDGTIEAVRVARRARASPRRAVAPEYDWEQDADSRAIFEAFGRAAAWSACAAARAEGRPALAQAAPNKKRPLRSIPRDLRADSRFCRLSTHSPFALRGWTRYSVLCRPQLYAGGDPVSPAGSPDHSDRKKSGARSPP